MAHDFLFYREKLPEDNGEFELRGDENHHLATVLRIKKGESVFVTDGKGKIVACRVLVPSRSRSLLVALGRIAAPARPAPVTLALGCIKRAAMEEALVHCTELGVATFQPFYSERSLRRSFNSDYLTRLRKLALAAMKQSFHPWLPSIRGPLEFEDMVQELAPGSFLVGRQGAPGPKGPWLGVRTIIIGPEGGLSPGELEMLERRGGTFVSVSPFRLRSETAAVALLSRLLPPASIDSEGR